MNEFDLIKTHFAPLAKDFPGSLDVSDDAALIDIPEGHELVITKDAISEGIHFIGNEDAGLIAKKLLRTNLSDLAAKAAKPLAYFLALMLPKTTSPDWIQRFAQGLGEDQSLYNIHLAGGDTISTLGPASFSLTALGTLKRGTMLKRNGARAGDSIVVSGTLGDSALGLHLLRHPRAAAGGSGDLFQSKKMDPRTPLRVAEDDEFLITRYLLPEPRLELGLSLHGIASSCMDISDGLVQDLGHICAASNVGAEIEMGKLPLSPAARQHPDAAMLALTGGDDYELLFTVPPDKVALIPAGCTRIGVIREGSGVEVLDASGKPVEIPHKGFQHF